ncbi:MAG: magnesium chelatase subunit D [Rhodobacteraceae bacterium]|nr:magnesium chelatase subunit D [Paracoccaceae bacterium]
MSDPGERWRLAHLALACLAIDPHGLGGAVVRARSGPARDRLLAHLPPGQSRIHPGIADDQLFGGVDIAATLSAGQVVRTSGVLSRAGLLVLAMAERCDAGLAAKLAQHLDGPHPSPMIVLDEGADPDEAAPGILTRRIAFHLDLDGLPVGALATPDLPTPPAPGAPGADLPEGAAAALTALAARFGIDDLRAPLLAMRCARAHAALFGRAIASEADIAAAAGLVYPSRATMIPEDPPEQDETPPEPPQPDDRPEDRPDGEDDAHGPEISGDMLIEAVKAMLPAGLLDQLAGGAARAATGSGAGQKRKGNRRGRPLPSRPGRMDGRARIDLVATLRAAAPWQPLRRKSQPNRPGLLIRASDIRLRRYEETSDRLLIFTVDASGSAAVSRLNEAKGAVELLLGEAYARRDHVALIAFRGTGAELLLPPTRSLVQTKRRLAALPGGGGTPLAAGLRAAAELAVQSRARGLTPTVVLMTDGRANIALDGSADRPRAAEDSATLARSMRARGLGGLLIDMSNRPQPALDTLAQELGAPYLPLPRADARRVSQSVTDALGTG